MNHLPIVKRAITHGQRIAVCSSLSRTTYSDLAERSMTMAARLLDDDKDLREARIAFLVQPGSEYIETQWGIWRAGGIAVPLSLTATEMELEYVLTDSQATAVVASQDLAANMEVLCKRLGLGLYLAGDCQSSAVVALPVIAVDRRAMILYTSGTTSKPKGVVTTHACIQAQIESLIDAWHWHDDDRIPLFLPLHHIHGIINVMSCALWSGAKIETFPRFDTEAILSRVAENAFTVFMAVPTIYVKLINALEALPAEQRELIVQGFANMRLMVSGSAALPASVHHKWTELTGKKLLERYGMTEIGMALSNPYDGERRPGAVGKPLPGVEIRLQSDSGKIVSEDGIAGEIQVRGLNVFREYWNQTKATHESFVDGWFRTGDIAVVEDGYHRIMGRSSVDIIKSGGYKLSALEIEAALLDHPAIAECAVVGLPDEEWGEVVATVVVLKHNELLTIDALHAWSKGCLSHYKIPRRLLVVEKLPRNAMGKITKPAVARLFDSEHSPEPA